MRIKIQILILIVGFTTQVRSQDSSLVLSQNYFEKVSEKASKISARITIQTSKALGGMKKQELKLKNKLARIDSIAAKNLFSGIDKQYSGLQQKLQSGEKIASHAGLNYIPYMDTLKNALNYLQNNIDKIKNKPAELQNKLSKATSNVNDLEIKLDQAQAIRQLLKERRQYLKEQLSKFGLGNRMKKLNKKVYYYSQSIQEYKAILKDPKKIETKAISLLRNVPAFKNFMQSNSQMASLFGMPSSGPNAVSFAGLQSRAAVQQVIQSSVANVGNNPQQFITQQISTANQNVSGNRNSIRLPEIAENMGEMPDFKPNHQKTKSLFKRLEYSANVQFGKTNRFLPTTSEIAANIGYKLNDNGVIGIGSSYKLGLGSGINHIRFSHQGFGLRSYLDWKLKGSIYITGGYEKNYLPQFTDISQSLKAWQKSGLIGISKKYPAGKMRKGYVQLLFDFLSYKNIPRSQPVLFRTGINF